MLECCGKDESFSIAGTSTPSNSCRVKVGNGSGTGTALISAGSASGVVIATPFLADTCIANGVGLDGAALVGAIGLLFGCGVFGCCGAQAVTTRAKTKRLIKIVLKFAFKVHLPFF